MFLCPLCGLGGSLMGPGHLGIGFAAKPLAPKVPLWVLLVATEVLDLLCFGFMAAGLETQAVTETSLSTGITYLSQGTLTWSHGLLMSLVWSALAAALAYRFFRDRRSSLVIGLLVFSHWLLDFLVHGPDLPLLLDGSPLLGLGLWMSGPGLVLSGILEVVLLAGGFAIYWRSRRQQKAQVPAAA